MVIIGSDHTGIDLKKKIIKHLEKEKINYLDVTNYKDQSGDDYPDIAYTICKKVLEKSNNLGIAICGTGIGISIACNKIKGIRAALCTDEYMAQMARIHNNANVLSLGARLNNSNEKSILIVDSFINNFYEGGRHDRRLEKIRRIEELEQKNGDDKTI